MQQATEWRSFMCDLYPIVIFSNGLFDYEILLADLAKIFLPWTFAKYRNQAQSMTI